MPSAEPTFFAAKLTNESLPSIGRNWNCALSRRGFRDGARADRHVHSFQRILHNHPSGDPTPSQADIQMTQQIIAVAGPLGISVHDHLIVGRDGHASLKGLRLI
jgi:hypothetical protein